LSQSWGESKLTAVRQAMIDYQLLCFVVCCAIAFSVVDSGFFIGLLLPCGFFTLHLLQKLLLWLASSLFILLALFILHSHLMVGLVKGTMKSIQCILLRLYDHRWAGAYWALSFW